MSVTFWFDEDTANEHTINLSNANAGYVLRALGYEEDVNAGCLGGECASEDFLGRVLVAEGISPTDPGRPVTQEGIMIDCGRREGYLQEKLAWLRDLAEAASKLSARIYWA